MAIHGCEHGPKTMCVYCLCSDFSLIEDANFGTHPAAESFKREMEGRAYGKQAINTAWDWFVLGWEAVFYVCED